MLKDPGCNSVTKRFNVLFATRTGWETPETWESWHLCDRTVSREESTASATLASLRSLCSGHHLSGSRGVPNEEQPDCRITFVVVHEKCGKNLFFKNLEWIVLYINIVLCHAHVRVLKVCRFWARSPGRSCWESSSYAHGRVSPPKHERGQAAVTNPESSSLSRM